MKIRFVVLFILCSCSLYAQQAANEIDLLSPDHSRLELTTFKKVNELRSELSLPDLLWDDVIYRAAKDHADYLLNEKRISHFQSVEGKKTPYERVKIHGGLVYTAVGENIVQVVLGVEFKTKGINRNTITYHSAAKTMAELWKSSPGHYKNIKSEKFNVTALAIAYDNKTQKLIAVQVFAFNPSPDETALQPDYSDQLMRMSIPKLPYKLKGFSIEAKETKAIQGFLNLKMDRGYLTGSFKKAKKIFKGSRSGLVQEFIPLSQYDSASSEFSMVPNRRNGLFELNGQLSKPVYRRELLNYCRKNTDRDYYSIKLFKKIIETPIKEPTTKFIFPLHPNYYNWEFNLFLIKNKKLMVHRTYTMLPGALFKHPFPELTYANSFKESLNIEKYTLHQQYDTLHFKFYYLSGEVKIPEELEQGVKYQLQSSPSKIISIDAEAYASIEGDKSENEKIAKERLNLFMDIIKPFMDSTIVKVNVQSREQWKFFRDQIEGTEFEKLKAIKMDEVRQFININKSDTVLSRLLDAQRYIEFKLIRRQEIKKLIPSKNEFQVYDSLKHEFTKIKKPIMHQIKSLEQAQLAVYDKILNSDSLNYILPQIPDPELYPVFKYHDLIFRYTVLAELDDKEFYDKLHKLGRSKHFPVHLKNQLIYNNNVLIFKSFFNDGEWTKMLDYKKLKCFKYRNSEFNLNKYKKVKCKRTEYLETPYYGWYYALKQVPAFIRLAEREEIIDFPVDELYKYYYLYNIHYLFPFEEKKIKNLLPAFKKYFHPDDTLLTEEERLTLAYFYCALKEYNIARNLVQPIATTDDPNKQALKLYLTLKYADYKNNHEYAELLISEFPRLGKEEWCDFWVNPRYLNFLLLEDLKLKKFYNCHCDR